MECPIRFLVITVSDRCSRGEAIDRSGPSLAEKIVNDKLGIVLGIKCVPDDRQRIEAELISGSFCSDVILTTGGTGLSPRDVTPEATKAIIDREVPGFPLAMTLASLPKSKYAILSRSACGVRGSCLIVNLPGSMKGSLECFEAVIPCLDHAVQLLRGADVRAQHGEDTSKIKSKVVLGNAANRPRESVWQMLLVTEAQRTILENLPVSQHEIIPLSYSAVGNVVSEDVICKEAVPPFRASIKDGYAVLVADGLGVRNVKRAITAGMSPELEDLMPGEIVRVNTGGPIPPNADAVVQVEDTMLVKATNDGEEEQVEILVAPTLGQDIRGIGSDIAKGETVLQRGDTIGSPELGLLAAVGVTHIPVYRLPRVGVLSTGNELIEAGKPSHPGAIRDSNRILLLGLLKENHFPVIDLGIVNDDPSKLLSSLMFGLNNCDVILTTGGVSMGERDLLKPILVEDLNATIHFGRVNMKPGKPTTFATCPWKNGPAKVFFCLPGNPVSAAVTFQLFVIPALRAIAGHLPNRRYQTIITARTNFEIKKLDPRPEYRRVVLDWCQDDGIPLAKSTGDQISSRLMSWREANGLLILPSSKDHSGPIPCGTLVKTLVVSRV